MFLNKFFTPKEKKKKSSLNNRQASFASMNDLATDGSVIATMRSYMRNMEPLTDNFSYLTYVILIIVFFARQLLYFNVIGKCSNTVRRSEIRNE